MDIQIQIRIQTVDFILVCEDIQDCICIFEKNMINNVIRIQSVSISMHSHFQLVFDILVFSIFT